MQTRHILIGMLTIGFLGILLASPLIAALPGPVISDNKALSLDGTEDTVPNEHDSDDDNVDDDVEEANSREIQIEAQDHQIQIESTLKNGETKNKLEIQIQSGSDGLHIQAEFKTEASDIESELKFKVQFYELTEFRDTNSNQFYEPVIDEFKSEMKLDNFAPAVYTNEKAPDNTTLHKIDISTVDGVFTAHIFIVENFQIINATTITPNEIKIDIEITNFNYLSTDSLLALYTKLETESEFENENETEDEIHGYADHEEGVKTTVNGVTGFFSWAETAVVDGVVKNVTISPIQDDDEELGKEKMYINYPQGQSIYHDPKIGIAGILVIPTATPTTTGQIPGYPIPIFLGVLIGALVITIRSHKRKQFLF